MRWSDVAPTGWVGAFFMLAACGERPLEPRDPTPGVPHFKIVSYNVENQNEQWDNPDTVRAIGSANADIICIQEATPSWETVIRDEYSNEYPHMIFHVTHDDTARGLAMLSRYPLTDQGLRPAPNNWHPAWHVLVDTPAGPLQVLNIHLRSLFTGHSNSVESYLKTDSDHLQEIELFTEQCADSSPTIIAGDFNEDEEGPAIEFLKEAGFRNILPLYRPGQFTFRSPSLAGQLTKAIDHILFNDALEPLNAWVQNEGGSDHLPVVAHFEAAYEWTAEPEPVL